MADVSPTTVAAGSSAFTLAITGSNFQSQAVVNWNSTPLTTTYNSSTSLSAAVAANLAAVGVVGSIRVANPDGQASSSGGTSSQVSVTNPVPTLTAVAPSVLYAGSSDTTFTFTGTNFNSSSVAMAGTATLTTTFVSSTQLTALVPAAILAPVGTLNFSVTNPAPGGGASQPLSISLKQPTATLSSLSPSSALVGSSAVTVTITGTYFTPTAAVYTGGFSPLTTRYISATSIQFTIPALSLSVAQTLSVVVRDPASQGLSSNILTFQVVNPVPVLNSISPANVTAGAPNFILTLTGSNFLQSSAILVNGTAAQPNVYPSGTSATVVIPASAVSTVGSVSIAVSNPAPGGGTSAAQTLNVISASNRIRTLQIAPADLGWDSAHNLLIASTVSTSPNNPNSIVTIDPLQGTVVTAQALPSQPAGISVTGDGSFAYVTLPSTGQVERLKLPSLTPDITFGLGNDSNGKFYMSNYVAAAPGSPHTVAITRHSSTTTGYGADGGVVVYDDGVPRTNIAYPGAYPHYYDDITWSSDATKLYATNSAVSFADEAIFSVNTNGVTLISDQQGVLDQFAHYLAYDPNAGRLFDDGGLTINAATGQQVGRFHANLSPSALPFALDFTQRKAFFLSNSVGSNGLTQDQISLVDFDLDRYTYINSMLIDGLTGGASAIVRWGSSGLAIAASQIYIIDGSFVSPSGISSATGGYAAPAPTLTSVSPVSVPTGSPDVQVTLLGRDFTASSEVTWNNQTLLINSVSDTQLVVTIPASLLTSPVASALTVSNGPGTGNSGSVAFTVLPDLGANAQINVLDISGQDLVWDNTHSLIYVAVPATDALYPSAIAVIDPSKPALQQSVPVLQAPSSIALSDDGQYLYSGFFSQAVIQRYMLPAFSLDLTIPSGGHAPSNLVGLAGTCTFAVNVKVAPGNPQTIAVAEGMQGAEPPACGGLDIYDNATPRPGYLPYYTGQDFSSLAWGADASTLYGQSEVFEPQTLSALSVSSTGVTLTRTANTGGLGLGVHFDAGTGLLYSDSGIITNPAGPAQVGKLENGAADLVVTDDGLKRIFVLTNTIGNPASGPGAASYTLDVYDLNTQALLNSTTIPGVLGSPVQMARWGINGIVFVTRGTSNTNVSPGALYILQGSAISGTP